MKFLRIFVGIVILASMSFAAVDTLDVYYFEKIVVTGTRTPSAIGDLPQSISLLENSAIKNEEQQPLLNLLSDNIPGLFVSNRTNAGYGLSSGGAGNISMRGVGSFPNTQVLVMIDGRPDVMGLFGHPLGDVYNTGNVEKVEVIRGPASVMYGSNAMGGVINIITKDINQKGASITVPLKYSSFNTHSYGINQQYGVGNFGYGVSLNYKKSEGFRDESEGKDDFESLNLNLVSNYKISNNLKTKANLYVSDYEVWDPGQVTAPYSDHVYDIRRSGGDISLLHDYDKLAGTLKIHHNFGKHDIMDGSDYDSEDYLTGIVLTETYNYAANSNITVGFDGRFMGGKAIIHGSWDDWKKHDVTELAGMVNLHHRLIDWMIIEGGLRYTDHSVTGDEVIPAIGAVANLPQNWNLKVQYAKGYRNPTINEMYLFQASTEDLKAEISETYEMSLQKSIAEYFHAGVTVYYTELEDLVEKTFINGPVYQNVGQVNMKGFELEGELLLPPSFGINLAYSYNDISDDITNSPKHKLNLGLRHNYNGFLFSKLEAQYISGLYSRENPYSYSNTALVETDAYFLLNFHTNYRMNDYLSLYGRIDNILDKDYEIMYGFPMPGRTFTLGITASYK